jgi:serine/threonine protein kinase/peptidoglycan hydrolase-like protein with peptidoglycan-binding domain
MNFKVKQTDGRIEKLFIDESRKLGRGATANVYRVQFNGKDLAAKIYHSGRVFNKTKIQAMLDHPPQNCEVIQNGQEYPQFAWPQFLVLDENNVEVGFLMPLVDANESFTLDYYYDPGLFKKLRSQDESALSYKLEIAKNLSLLVADLHRQGHFIIDCKPQNIRVFRRNHVVTLLDCDGFSVNGKGNRFPAELLSTDYIAPEAQLQNSSPAELNEFQDRYALAVILFQLLNRGTHPFQGILSDNSISANTNDEKAALKLYPHGTHPNPKIKPRPQSTHHLWPEETRALFDQAFTSTFPSERPSASVWAKHFDTLLATKTLVRCDKFPDDAEHIRFRDLDCPACYLKSPASATPISKTPQPLTRGTASLHPRPSQTLQSTYKQAPQAESSFSVGWGIVLTIIIILVIWFAASSGEKKPTQPSSSSTTRPSLPANIQSPQTSPNTTTTPTTQSGAQLPILGDGLKAGLRWPLIGTVTAHYGASRPGGGVWRGILIKASDGMPVASVGDGTVVYSDWLRGFGNLVIVEHGEQYLSVYGYNQTILKKFGDSVKAGDIVALAGRTGEQVDPALYFEIRHRGKSVDPLGFLSRSTAASQSPTVSIAAAGAAAPTPDKLVQDLQTALNEKGFNAGIVDGFMGPQTEAAISSAQKTLGLVINGIASRELLVAITSMSKSAAKKEQLNNDYKIACSSLDVQRISSRIKSYIQSTSTQAEILRWTHPGGGVVLQNPTSTWQFFIGNSGQPYSLKLIASSGSSAFDSAIRFAIDNVVACIPDSNSSHRPLTVTYKLY